MAYNTIGPGAAAPALVPEMGTFILPAGIAFALWHDYTYPDQTAYHRGVESAKLERAARLYREERERAAQDRAQAIADNKALEQYYATEIAKGNGALVVEGDNYRKTITGYNPHNGTITARVDYPKTGSYMEGTFPEVNYRPLEDGRNFDELTNAEIVYKTGPYAGRWTAKPGYFDYQTQQYEPDMLIESYQQPITLSAPTALTAEPKLRTAPLVLSSGAVAALPADINDYRVFNEAGGQQNGSGSQGGQNGNGGNAGNGRNGRNGRNGGGNNRWRNRRAPQPDPDQEPTITNNFKQGWQHKPGIYNQRFTDPTLNQWSNLLNLTSHGLGRFSSFMLSPYGLIPTVAISEAISWYLNRDSEEKGKNNDPGNIDTSSGVTTTEASWEDVDAYYDPNAVEITTYNNN